MVVCLVSILDLVRQTINTLKNTTQSVLRIRFDFKNDAQTNEQNRGTMNRKRYILHADILNPVGLAVCYTFKNTWSSGLSCLAVRMPECMAGCKYCMVVCVYVQESTCVRVCVGLYFICLWSSVVTKLTRTHNFVRINDIDTTVQTLPVNEKKHRKVTINFIDCLATI